MKLLQTKHVTISVDRTSLREKIEGVILWGLLVVALVWWKKGSKSQS
ncbi:hypothetical protein [Lactiplantibacillus pentosus]|nr:hypothetical protein [Lactiplantibacillus pentosus]MBQ0835300.1 hypothetical protein [Lactiplantibacillus pentosus]MBU7465315.1 hypothetical protein [Lactiplantibacillus pentosus]MBU7490713.1 hypothetical protein [Lactiplantibacillus pentosus]MBU7492554.1 hypothetical protein [Lactiplantibacillus pentosus]MBU7520388.1 hypothetical protein [Lactiplantibacillus pentosus]